jgi:hypothetical protein
MTPTIRVAIVIADPSTMVDDRDGNVYTPPSRRVVSFDLTGEQIQHLGLEDREEHPNKRREQVVDAIVEVRWPKSAWLAELEAARSTP